MRRFIVPSLLLVLVALPATTAAEEPPSDPAEGALALIDSGRAALVAGRAQEAIDKLQRAIGLIQGSVAKTLSTFLVDSVGELKGGTIDVQNGIWGAGADAFQWNSATRTYRRAPDDPAASDGLEVEVVISNSPQLLQVHKASLEVYENPQMRSMLEKSGGVKLESIREGAWKGLILSQPGEGAQVMAFAEGLMVQIRSSSGDLEVVKRFWKAMDTAGLAEAK